VAAGMAVVAGVGVVVVGVGGLGWPWA